MLGDEISCLVHISGGNERVRPWNPDDAILTVWINHGNTQAGGSGGILVDEAMVNTLFLQEVQEGIAKLVGTDCPKHAYIRPTATGADCLVESLATGNHFEPGGE